MILMYKILHIDGLVQDGGNSTANARELLPYCTKPLIVYIRDCVSQALVQDCGNSIALAMELPQSCTKPLILYITCVSLLKVFVYLVYQTFNLHSFLQHKVWLNLNTIHLVHWGLSK